MSRSSKPNCCKTRLGFSGVKLENDEVESEGGHPMHKTIGMRQFTVK
jgi:hypothetical protein